MNIEQILTNILSGLGVVVAFGLVVFIHEFGHFFVAKKTGVKVEAFAFGFGKEIFGFQWGETRYSLNWIPLGGYVRMAGEVPDDYEGPVLEKADLKNEPAPDNADHSREFLVQPWYRRIPIVLAGPFMNYVLAVFIFFLTLLIWGEPVQTNKTQVGNVVQEMPAAKAGLLTGDRIVSVEGEVVADFTEVAAKIHQRPEIPTQIAIQRGETAQMLTITPIKDVKSGKGLIGIQPADPILSRTKKGLVESFTWSVSKCWEISYFTVYYLAKKIGARERPDVAGPIGIVHVVSKVARTSFEDFLYLIGYISVAIGLFNLFPIPMLDGGHLAYYVIEGIRGKPLSQRTMGKANMVGMALLASLLIFATFNDVQRIWPGGKKPAGIESTEK